MEIPPLKKKKWGGGRKKKRSDGLDQVQAFDVCWESKGAQETVVRLMPHYFCTWHRLCFPSPPPGLHLILFQLPFLCICFTTTFLLFLLILSETMIGFMGQSQPYRPVCPRALHQRVARTLAGSSVSDAPPRLQKRESGYFLAKTKCKRKDVLFTG